MSESFGYRVDDARYLLGELSWRRGRLLEARRIWGQMEADRAFGQAKRARRQRKLFRRSAELDVHDETSLARRSSVGSVREIPLDAIVGTFDPGRTRRWRTMMSCVAANCSCSPLIMTPSPGAVCPAMVT